jgi:hypothetical protein
MTRQRTALWTLLFCCTLLQSCAREHSQPVASAAKTESPTAGPPAAASPCKLLTVAEVSAAAPHATAGKPDAADAANGVYACIWETAAGRVWLQAYLAGPSSVSTAILGHAPDLVDPSTKGAIDKVRIETFAGVGDGAMAIVEHADPARGILSSKAILVVKRGEYMATLFAPELALGDRAMALQKLQALGGQIASRL